MIFSEFVIFVRKKLNLSQKQLADAIDVSHSTIEPLGKLSCYAKQFSGKKFFRFL